MTLDEALNVSNKELAEYLDGLPEEKMHCSVMGKEALEAAVANYRGEDHSHEEEDEGKIVCHCFAVTDRQIEKAITENSLTTIGQITNYTKAGGACGSCLGKIDTILQTVLSRSRPLPEPRQNDFDPIVRPEGKMSMYKKIRLIEEVMEKEIRPALGYDHGGLELLDIEENTVYIRLTGKCHSCTNNDSTLAFIRSQLENILGEPIDLQNLE
jgi:NifU-like protein